MHALLRFLSFHLLLSLGHNAFGSEIINGEVVPDKDMLYMASVQNDGSHTCGGFLITEDFVLTAAHCDKKNLSVVLGTHNLKANNLMRYSVKKCKHPQYKHVATGRDIMLLKLLKKARKDERIQTIEIPKRANNLKDNESCLVAGWGLLSQGKKTNNLQKVKVPVVNIEECKRQWSQAPAKTQLPKDVLCAGGSPGNSGFCQGDSGGPLVCGDHAVGIVSFNYKEKCKYPNIPNVYVDISKHLSWINKILTKRDC